MKFVVISASPKGDKSGTLQYLRYIESRNPGHEFSIHHIGKEYRTLEKKPEQLRLSADEVKAAHGVIWVFPVYYLLVPYPLKRFIELIFEEGLAEAFAGKYATTLTTSAHFFDHTAHAYIHQISQDLGMHYVEGFSAAMQDLLKAKKRKQILYFADRFFKAAENGVLTEKRFADVVDFPLPYRPGKVKPSDKFGGKKVVVLTDAKDSDENLNAMIKVFRQSSPSEVELINLWDMKIKGQCLSCYRCCYDGVCVYKDDMRSLYEDKLMKADAVVFAGAIKDRFLSSRWKLFFDRSFFMGHRHPLMGKQFAAIISGPLRQIPNLRDMLSGLFESSRGNNSGFVTDEYPTGEQVTARIVALAEEIDANIEHDAKKPETFFGTGGRLLFRDFTYVARPLFMKDYAYYARQGYLKYPTSLIGMRAKNFVLAQAFKIPKVRNSFFKAAHEKMIEPFIKIIEKSDS